MHELAKTIIQQRAKIIYQTVFVCCCPRITFFVILSLKVHVEENGGKKIIFSVSFGLSSILRDVVFHS